MTESTATFNPFYPEHRNFTYAQINVDWTCTNAALFSNTYELQKAFFMLTLTEGSARCSE
jgi:hypothetical protein